MIHQIKSQINEIEKEDTFLITYDHIEGKKVFLFFGEKEQLQEFKDNLDKCHAFKLYDADKELYYIGLSSKKDSFSPLDLFGINSGCTDIKYIN